MRGELAGARDQDRRSGSERQPAEVAIQDRRLSIVAHVEDRLRVQIDDHGHELMAPQLGVLIDTER